MRRIIALLIAALMCASACLAEQVDTSHVADAGDRIAAEDVLEPGMQPVAAEALADGTYDVAVDSSSSMFKIASATVTKEGDALTASLVIASDSYMYLYPGTAEAAAQAEIDQLVAPEALGEDGNRFTFAIDALDAPVDCAAFSRAKQQWYPRVLVFRADSLPAEAFNSAEGAALEDGAYAIPVRLEGGSGRTQVESPAQVIVQNGEATARLVFNTEKIDFVMVGDEKFLPEYEDGTAVFTLPAASLARPMAVDVDSTVMKPATLVRYTLSFDADQAGHID
ncbi:MAG: hypothetical protein E7317_00765 [Clostridiales bacterium]|nr:hypothetical protein [Clostridiales bacterium]